MGTDCVGRGRGGVGEGGVGEEGLGEEGGGEGNTVGMDSTGFGGNDCSVGTGFVSGVG